MSEPDPRAADAAWRVRLRMHSAKMDGNHGWVLLIGNDPRKQLWLDNYELRAVYEKCRELFEGKSP